MALNFDYSKASIDLAREKIDLLIDNVPLHTYGGASLLDYVIGPTPMDNVIFQGANRTHWSNLRSTFGLREIRITVIFSGKNLHEAKLKRSMLNGRVCDKCEIYIPGDGFYYTCTCVDLGEETIVGMGEQSAQIKATYKFKAIRHGQLRSATYASGAIVYCDSTMPRTDCRLITQTKTSAATFRLGTAVFHDVPAAAELIFDGITGAVRQNGVNVAATTDFTEFPYLYPGANAIQCATAVTVEYYPTYI